MLLLTLCLLFAINLANSQPNPTFVDELVKRVGYSDDDLQSYLNLLSLANAPKKGAIDPLTGKPPKAFPVAKKVHHHVNEIQANSMLLYEGDITLSRNQIDRMTSRFQSDTANNKPKSLVFSGRGVLTGHLSARWATPINYNFDTATGVDSASIQLAINLWRDNTCLTFKQNNNPSSGTDYIQFFKGSGCYSTVGFVGGKQTVSIGDGCEYLGIMAHEIGHSLGLWHEQSRPDRDDYVQIVSANIQPGTAGNFQKQNAADVTLYNYPYDFGSVMHYAPTSFSLSSALTIQPIDPNYKSTPGQREGLSFYDIKLINTAYCSNVCAQTLPCQRNGYTDPKDCSRCRCPNGLGGQYCETALAADSTCGSINLVATSSWQTLSASDIASCNWLITSGGSGKKIQLKVQTFSMYCQAPTCTSYFVEFRYGKDLADTGARLCCTDSPGTLTTATPEALILYRGAYQNKFSLQYKLDGSGAPQTTAAPLPITNPTVTATTTVPIVTVPVVTTTKRPRPTTVPTVPWVTQTTELPWWLQTTTERPQPVTTVPWVTQTTRRPTPWWFTTERPTKPSRRTRFPEVTVPWVTDRPKRTRRPHGHGDGDGETDNVAITPVPLGYSEWAGWSTCSDPCGGCGVSTRIRVCFDNSCPKESETETKRCGVGICYGKCSDPLNDSTSTIIPRLKRQCGYCCNGYVPDTQLQQCVRKSVRTVGEIVRGALDSVLTPFRRA